MNSEPTPLHTLNPLTRFSLLVEDYVKHRPSYPDGSIDIILKGLDNESQLIAADIGAGTGISSRLLAKRKINVIAIEPNVAMRKAAEPHPLVEWRDGTAEFTKLSEKSVDLVTCFQAFHWFTPEPSLREFRRILKPSGRLAVVWNNCDNEDAFTGEYSRIIRKASNHPAESRMKSVEPLLATSYFGNLREYTFIYRQELDLNGLIGRAMSVSYLPREGAVHEQLIADLKSAYHFTSDRQGFVYIVYRTSVHLAESLQD
jgi:SAM-dependent methyltransferase